MKIILWETGQLLGKLIRRKQVEERGGGREQETRNDPASKSNNVFIIYFIIHLWMCSDGINNRNPWEEMFALEPYYEQAKCSGTVS